ncbi:GNAT family N-acetyltransferase [Paenibacillus soyae]|uniref:GNAT family N-acetyltransferase n=1 Tax=Paenibacillus soyae TaxID=2969249 RepID=A0A9X2SBB9_9BACL|nr:GNAT family N-acetyltransferase [Paenibacillus soyae]MCR2807126.1 GNAT family N-acetyltransferase [Paenibacillus soyae]
MIRGLNNREEDIAQYILDVQLPAYRVEAELIGYDDIPPLRDTVDTIRNSKETFVGYFIEQELAGFISYESADDAIDLCRMVVHPGYFRRGIAKRLLAYVLADAASSKKVTVSTGARNEPAKSLYRGFGFVLAKELEVAPGLSLAFFELDRRGQEDHNIV